MQELLLNVTNNVSGVVLFYVDFFIITMPFSLIEMTASCCFRILISEGRTLQNGIDVH